MAEDCKMTSIIIQRMVQRSNAKRIKAASDSKMVEERAVILRAIGADHSYSEGSDFHFAKPAESFTSQTINYEDKKFCQLFPWNPLSFSLTQHLCPMKKVEEEMSDISSSPVRHSTQKSSQNFKESISEYVPKSNGSSLEDFKTEHTCSRTNSSITQSPNGSANVNNTGYSEFSDCFHCNAMLVHKDLCKWKKAVSTSPDTPEAAPISLASDKSPITSSYGWEELASFVPTDKIYFLKDLKTATIRQSKRFKSPLRSSSPELEISWQTKFPVLEQQKLEQEENGTSMESLSTIPDRESDCASLLATKEYKDLEAMVLHAAEVNEINNMEDNLTQQADATAYNVEWFLRDALGDEMDISICTDSHDGQAKRPESLDEYCTSNRGESLFHTISSYRMLTNLKRQKVRPDLTSLKIYVPVAPKSTTEKQIQATVQSLLSKAEIHMSIILQASKALDLCDKSQAFILSRERVECERLLLISTHMRNAAYDEIHRLKFEESADTCVCFENGTVCITGLSIGVKENFQKGGLFDMDMKTWFVCLMSHSGRVLATDAEGEIKEGNIRFSGCYTFTELRKDFTIKIQVYCLKLRKRTPGRQSKPLSLMPMTVFGCPVLCKKGKNSLSKVGPDLHERIQTSSFSLAGELHLCLHDVRFSKPWPLHKVTLSSPLIGTIDMELKTSLKLTAEYSGFLNFSEEFSLPGSWQKYWFYLKEHMLHYWNYPSDKDVKEPVGKIDLSKCLSRTIGPVSRNQCARPRTFVIEMSTQDTTSNIMRHFLSADTELEMNQWCSILNKVIRSMREWNIIHFNF